jgi:hypothetical protein
MPYSLCPPIAELPKTTTQFKTQNPQKNPIFPNLLSWMRKKHAKPQMGI